MDKPFRDNHEETHKEQPLRPEVRRGNIFQMEVSRLVALCPIDAEGMRRTAFRLADDSILWLQRNESTADPAIMMEYISPETVVLGPEGQSRVQRVEVGIHKESEVGVVYDERNVIYHRRTSYDNWDIEATEPKTYEELLALAADQFVPYPQYTDDRHKEFMSQAERLYMIKSPRDLQDMVGEVLDTWGSEMEKEAISEVRRAEMEVLDMKIMVQRRIIDSVTGPGRNACLVRIDRYSDPKDGKRACFSTDVYNSPVSNLVRTALTRIAEEWNEADNKWVEVKGSAERYNEGQVYRVEHDRDLFIILQAVRNRKF